MTARCGNGARECRAVPESMTALGFNLVPGRHPIIPVMLGDADRATRMAASCWRTAPT